MNDVSTVFLDEIDRIIARAEARLAEPNKSRARSLTSENSAALKPLRVLRDNLGTERKRAGVR